MLPSRTRDNRPADTPPEDAAAGPEPLSAGARYRRHLDRFPERPTCTALERAAKALIRAAQLRLRAPRRAN